MASGSAGERERCADAIRHARPCDATDQTGVHGCRDQRGRSRVCRRRARSTPVAAGGVEELRTAGSRRVCCEQRRRARPNEAWSTWNALGPAVLSLKGGRDARRARAARATVAHGRGVATESSRAPRGVGRQSRWHGTVRARGAATTTHVDRRAKRQPRLQFRRGPMSGSSELELRGGRGGGPPPRAVFFDEGCGALDAEGLQSAYARRRPDDRDIVIVEADSRQDPTLSRPPSADGEGPRSLGRLGQLGPVALRGSGLSGEDILREAYVHRL